MDDRDFLDLLIAHLPGLCLKDRICLSKVFEREDDLLSRSREDIEVTLGHSLNIFWDINEIRSMAERDVNSCKMRSIQWVSWNNSDYPPLLREIYDPPVGIFFRGELPNPEKPLLGMVGTRQPSKDALAQAYTIARELGQMGISIVSGLAIGIDAISHRGNLDGGAPGFAVLGSGVDQIYPLSNKALAGKILDTGGALISEYPPGTPAYKWNFPARNRIIAALSRSMLIVEAPGRSGALISADFALEQGKETWVASSGIEAAGTNRLASDGADIIYNARDILTKWNMETSYNNEINANESDREPVAQPYVKQALAASMAEYLGIDL